MKNVIGSAPKSRDGQGLFDPSTCTSNSNSYPQRRRDAITTQVLLRDGAAPVFDGLVFDQ